MGEVYATWMASTSATVSHATWVVPAADSTVQRSSSRLLQTSFCRESSIGISKFVANSQLQELGCRKKLLLSFQRKARINTHISASCSINFRVAVTTNSPIFSRKLRCNQVRPNHVKWRVLNGVQNINYDNFRQKNEGDSPNQSGYGELLATVPLLQFSDNEKETTSSVDGKDAQGLPVNEDSERGGAGEAEGGAQRRYDPQRLFVGNLPFKVPAPKLVQELSTLFSSYGKIEEVDLAIHKRQTQASRERGKHAGFAFIRMGSCEEASSAMQALNNQCFLGACLQVSPGIVKSGPHISRDRAENEGSGSDRGREGGRYPGRRHVKLFVGGLYSGTDETTLKEIFAQYGKVVDVKIVRTRVTKQSLGFGFVTLHNAEAALKAMEDRDGSLLDGTIIKVNISQFARIT